MSMILCPECGSKISDKATMCPHCGFQSNDPLLPISEQDTYENIPVFDYCVEDDDISIDDLSVSSYEDNKRLVNYFGKWDNIQTSMPAIAEVIIALANKENVMIAKIEPYVKKLIDNGTYSLMYDKHGAILPTIRDSNGIVKQIRLENASFSPDLLQAINNLSTQARMASIIDKLEYIEDALMQLDIGLQNDRLAKSEAAHDKLKQARLIQDTKLREIAILGIINSATDAKRVLMRNFSQNLNYILEHSNESGLKLLKSKKEETEALNRKSLDSFQALMYINNSVQVECEGYSIIGEYEPCRECLSEYKKFIESNNLDKRDTLLLLNEHSDQKKIELVDHFVDIANRISTFNTHTDSIEYHIPKLLCERNNDKEEICNE